MSIIEQLMSSKIQKIDPDPNAQAYGRKVIQLACKDFLNYMKATIAVSADENLEYKLEQIASKKHSEFDSFLTVWTCMWTSKWKERVKLVINSKHKNEQNETEKIQKPEFNLQNHFKEELIDAVICALVNNGEICGTNIIAEHIIEEEISKNKIDFRNKTEAITFLENVLRCAHNITKTSGL